MDQIEYKNFVELNDFEKAFYMLLKNLGIDVQINDANEGQDRLNISESDMPKVTALWDFFSALKDRDKEVINHRSHPGWDIPELEDKS